MSLHMLFFLSVWISFMISFLALSSFTSHSSFCSISNSHLMLFSLPVTLVELDFWHQNSQWPKSRSLYLPSQHLILLSLQLICMRVRLRVLQKLYYYHIIIWFKPRTDSSLTENLQDCHDWPYLSLSPAASRNESFSLWPQGFFLHLKIEHFKDGRNVYFGIKWLHPGQAVK